jgi:hypothetical protein
LAFPRQKPLRLSAHWQGDAEQCPENRPQAQKDRDAAPPAAVASNIAPSQYNGYLRQAAGSGSAILHALTRR